MRSFALLAALMGFALAAPAPQLTGDIAPRDNTTNKGYLIADPKKNGVIVTKDNTLNGTVDNSQKKQMTIDAVEADALEGNLKLSIVNNFGGEVNAYIQGLDSDGAIVFLKADGSVYYPSSGGSAEPVAITEDIAIPLGTTQGDALSFTIPIVLTSGRVYFVSQGELTFSVLDTGSGDGLVQPSPANIQDPSAGLDWGFVELSYTKDLAVYANVTYVDFVGLVMSLLLTSTDGSTQSTISLTGGSLSTICNGLAAQTASDGLAWSESCITSPDTGALVRAVSPRILMGMDSSAFSGYYGDYIDQVWTKYSTETLVIDTQINGDSSDLVNCGVSGDQLTCDGDSSGYAKPTASEIFGCDGVFGQLESENAIHTAVRPRLCAAFVRSTLLLDGGNTQPSLDASNYYTVDPTDHYARLLHENEVDGKGYAFPYDDVSPSGNDDASGLISTGTPELLTIYCGGSQ